MSANFNKVILAGNLTRDPELRYTTQGTAIAKISLAINERWTDAQGQKKERTLFVEVDAFGKQAEVIGQYCRKGKPLLVEGRLKLDQWDDKTTGQKRQRLGVVLESFQFIDSKKENEGENEKETEPRKPAPGAKATGERATAPAESDVPPIEEDDVPF